MFPYLSAPRERQADLDDTRSPRCRRRIPSRSPYARTSFPWRLRIQTTVSYLSKSRKENNNRGRIEVEDDFRPEAWEGFKSPNILEWR